MGQVISNLKVRFGADNSDFKKGLSDSDKALRDFDNKIRGGLDSLKQMFTPLALLAGAGGALAMLKDSISAVEGPGDRFEAVMGGAKESLFEFQRALATLDFSNFFDNLTEGFERGKEFAEALDNLADRAAYNDYKIAELNRESEALQEIVKNKTLELSVRTEAANKVLEIEGRIVKRKLELAQEEFEIAKGQWESRNKMEADEAIKLYEVIDGMGPELQARLQKAFFTSTQNYLGNIKQGVQSVLFGQYDPQLVKDVDKSTLESYAKFFKLIETGEKDILIKLFNTFKDIDQAGYEAQKEYNGVIAQTTRLLAQEEKQLQANKTAVQDLNETKQVVSPFGRAETGNLTMPTLGQSGFLGLVAPAKAASDSLKMVMADIDQINKAIEMAIESALVGFGEWLGNFAVGTAGISDLVKMIGNAFGDMLIQLGKIAIETGVGIAAIKTALKSLNPAVAIAAGIGLVAFGSMIKSGVSQIGGSAGSSGNGSSGFSGTGEGKSFIYNNSTPAPLVIHLNGKLTAEGPDLVHVFNYETTRRRNAT